MVRGVAQKHTRAGSRNKFVWGSGGKIRITLTVEDTQVVIGGVDARKVQSLEVKVKGLGGVVV